MSADLVSALLSPHRKNSSNYGSRDLSDHLPMALTALVAMGATETRAATWAQAYSKRVGLRPATAGEQRGRQKWRERIERDGAESALQHAARTMADGMGAAAFHPIIRSAYAFARADDEDLAAAFESWEREYLRMPTFADAPRMTVRQALAALVRSEIKPDVAGLIATRMRLVGAHDAFAAVASVVPRAHDIDGLATAAATAFYRSGNLTALHVMTATHALRVLGPHLADADAIMPAFWSAYAAAAIVAGTSPAFCETEFDGFVRTQPAPWDATLARAIEQDDEHVIKATYTAWQLDQTMNSPVFHAAANRYIEKHRHTSQSS